MILLVFIFLTGYLIFIYSYFKDLLNKEKINKDIKGLTLINNISMIFFVIFFLLYFFIISKYYQLEPDLRFLLDNIKNKEIYVKNNDLSISQSFYSFYYIFKYSLIFSFFEEFIKIIMAFVLNFSIFYFLIKNVKENDNINSFNFKNTLLNNKDLLYFSTITSGIFFAFIELYYYYPNINNSSIFLRLVFSNTIHIFLPIFILYSLKIKNLFSYLILAIIIHAFFNTIITFSIFIYIFLIIILYISFFSFIENDFINNSYKLYLNKNN